MSNKNIRQIITNNLNELLNEIVKARLNVLALIID